MLISQGLIFYLANEKKLKKKSCENVIIIVTYTNCHLHITQQ